eukprot:8474084-Pyramimonas_sp.AAC.1
MGPFEGQPEGVGSACGPGFEGQFRRCQYGAPDIDGSEGGIFSSSGASGRSEVLHEDPDAAAGSR